MNILNKINSIKTQNELKEFRKIINEALDNRANFISLCEVANTASQKSFGYIKEAFEAISPSLFSTQEGKKVINKYLKVVKENKNLSNLYTLYETVRKANADTDMDYFTSNITGLNLNVDKKTLKEDIAKLGKVLAEGILATGNDAEALLPSTENTKLNNALNFIAENKKNSKNLNKYSDAIKVIRENIENNPKNNVFNENNLDIYAANLLETFNRKYSSVLTEEELNIIKEVNKSANKEELFNKFKNECINKLTEAEKKYKQEGITEDYDKVNAVLDKINKKTFVLENVTTDICGFAEISKIFE